MKYTNEDLIRILLEAFPKFTHSQLKRRFYKRLKESEAKYPEIKRDDLRLFALGSLYVRGIECQL